MSAPHQRADITGGALGIGRNYQWWANATEVDMAVASRAPVPLRIGCEPPSVKVDLNGTANVLIDMQNHFCSEGGWVDHVGADYTPDRAPMTARFLRNLGIRSILFTGINTDQGVMYALTGGNFLGYECVLMSDCCATTSPDCTEAVIWNVKKCCGFATGSNAIMAARRAAASQ